MKKIVKHEKDHKKVSLKEVKGLSHEKIEEIKREDPSKCTNFINPSIMDRVKY